MRVTFGLVPGSGDLIGFRSYTIRPEDVGKTVAVFTSVEVKRPSRAHTQANQIAWRECVRQRGGIAIISSCPDQALTEVVSWTPQNSTAANAPTSPS